QAVAQVRLGTRELAQREQAARAGEVGGGARAAGRQRARGGAFGLGVAAAGGKRDRQRLRGNRVVGRGFRRAAMEIRGFVGAPQRRQRRHVLRGQFGLDCAGGTQR